MENLREKGQWKERLADCLPLAIANFYQRPIKVLSSKISNPVFDIHPTLAPFSDDYIYILWMARFSWGTSFRGGSDPRNLVPTKKRFSVLIMEENACATNFEPHECVIFAQSTKIDTHEN